MTTNRNFNDLYAFTQVVKLGNFSRAAQSLGVQPSALSHRMNDLENRLNTKLLNRTTRSMSPTEAGQRLYERIAPMFGGIQEELAALGDLGGTLWRRALISACARSATWHRIWLPCRFRASGRCAWWPRSSIFIATGSLKCRPNWCNTAASCLRSTPLTAWTTGNFSKTGKSTGCACLPASPSTARHSSKPPPSTAWG